MEFKEETSRTLSDDGYTTVVGIMDGKEYGSGDFEMTLCFVTETGALIGEPEWAELICGHWGIKPRLAKPDHSTCSVGWSEKHQKWFGWSRRALHGFQVGDSVKKGDCAYQAANEADYIQDRGRFWTGKTLDDAKRMAIDFAAGVN